ncbi:MAG: hypothetical protein AAB562_04380, partial [Patescibacteria group bacterium]
AARRDGKRYVATFAEKYPAAGETWFCRIDRNTNYALTKAVYVTAVLKVPDKDPRRDLEELAQTVQATWNLHPTLLQ